MLSTSSFLFPEWPAKAGRYNLNPPPHRQECLCYLDKELADRGFLVNRANAAREQACYAQHFKLAHLPRSLRYGHGIGGHDFLDLRLRDAIDGRAGEHGVGTRGICLRGAFANQGFGGFYQRASSVDDVVHDQGAAAADIADQVHHLADVDIDAALVHDGEGRIEALGEETSAFHAASVRRNDGQIWQIQVPEMLDENRGAVQMVDRYVEIALNLRSVQIQRERAAGACGFEQVRDELRGDRDARLVFAVLPGVAVVRQHCGDAPSGRAFESVNHKQELEQVVVHRVTTRLHDEDIGAANVFENLKINLSVTEAT